MRALLLLLVASLVWAGSLHAQIINAMTGSGLQTSVAVDSIYKSGSAGPGRDSKGEVRGAEIMFYAPIDQTFDGFLNIAAHPESAGSFFEVHEAYIRSSRLFNRFRFRAGQFFLGIGRLNSFHRHDWPFISAPKVHETFFDDEGVSDTGVEVRYLMPTNFFWDLTVGVTNGWHFGHTHSIGEKPEVPVHYIRSTHYTDLPKQGGLQYGFNYLGRRNAAGTQFDYFGVDGAARWRQGRILKTFIQGEWWVRKQTPRLADSESLTGGYIYPQIALSPTWRFGVRGDYFTNLSLKSLQGNHLENYTYALVPTLTWQASEFSRFSLAFTHQVTENGSGNPETETAIELLSVFILGAHPAHQF